VVGKLTLAFPAGLKPLLAHSWTLGRCSSFTDLLPIPYMFVSLDFHISRVVIHGMGGMVPEYALAALFRVWVGKKGGATPPL